MAVNCDTKVKLIPKAVGAVANERVGRAEALDGAVAVVGLPAVRGEGAGIDCALDPQKARGFEALSGFAAVIAASTSANGGDLAATVGEGVPARGRRD